MFTPLVVSSQSNFMLTPTQHLYCTCTQFLEQDHKQRLLTLKQLGLARYADFLTQMPLTEANVACLMRFIKNPSRVKFPNLRGSELSGLILDSVNFIKNVGGNPVLVRRLFID